MTDGDLAQQPDQVKAAVAWIVDYLSQRLELTPAALPLDVPFNQLGVDSMFAVVMSEDISAWTGVEGPPNLLYQHPTILELARYIAAPR